MALTMTRAKHVAAQKLNASEQKTIEKRRDKLRR